MPGITDDSDAKQFYAAYLDVVGIKEVSKLDAPSYRLRMENFYEAVRETLGPLNKDRKVMCWLFSDSAIFTSHDVTRLARLVSEVRMAALDMADPILIKGCLVQSRREDKDIWNQAVKAVGDGILNGFSFSATIVRAYIDQEQFKGIGISVHSNIRDDTVKDADGTCLLVPSICFPQARSSPISYRDITFNNTRNAYSSGTLDKLLDKFCHAKFKSYKFERFYTSLFCAWLAGMEREHFMGEQDQPKRFKDKNGKTDGALEFFGKLGKGYFEKRFSSVEGRKYIYLAAWKTLHRLFPEKEVKVKRDSSMQPPEQVKEASRYFGTLSKLERLLDDLPEPFFSAKEKEEFIRERVRLSR